MVGSRESVKALVWSPTGERLACGGVDDEPVRCIDPDSGKVTGNIDLQGLNPPDQNTQVDDVLNGIARNPADGGIWVTGKRWPWLYRIELVPKTADEPTQKPTESR